MGTEVLHRVGVTCDRPLRTGDRCGLYAGHRGRHSASVFTCDMCGKRFRGSPAGEGYVSTCGGFDQEWVTVCFLCNEGIHHRTLWETVKAARKEKG